MIIVSNLQFASDERFNEKLSIKFNKYFENYTNYIKNENLIYRFEPRDMFFRKDHLNYIDVVIIIWIFGLCLREIKKIFIYGIKDYLSSWNNILIAIMHILFVCSYSLKIYTIIILKMEIEKINDPQFWSMINNIDQSIELQKEVYKTFYWLNEGFIKLVYMIDYSI